MLSALPKPPELKMEEVVKLTRLIKLSTRAGTGKRGSSIKAKVLVGGPGAGAATGAVVGAPGVEGNGRGAGG